MKQVSAQKLYIQNITPLFNGRWQEFLPQLPPARQARVLACRNDADAARLTAAGLLLRQALLRAGIAEGRQVFLENTWGKPYLPDGPEFSLSHAGPYAVCAIDCLAVGVDVEALRCTMALARRCFHPDELSFLQKLSSDDQPDVLCRLWTAKEAYCKFCGLGLHLPLASFSVELLERGAVLHAAATDTSVLLHEYWLDSGYRLCLCSKSPRPALTWIDS